MAGLRGYVQFNKYTHTCQVRIVQVERVCPFCRVSSEVFVVSTIDPPLEDKCEWRRMTRMTGPDCAVMCNLINTHTRTHTCDQRFS